MNRWALRTLIFDRASFLASCAGVAVAFLLVLLIEGMFVGESTQVVSYLEHSRAKIWVMQEGVSNMHMATSFIRSEKTAEVAEIPGVASVTPILYFNALVQAGGTEHFAYVVGFPGGAVDGGPWKMTGGKSRPGPGEAIIPDVLARKTGLGLGDQIAISDVSLQVTGLSSGTFSMANPIVFVSLEQLEKILGTIDVVSYLLVEPAQGVSSADLARRIRGEVEDVEVLPRSVLIENDYQLGMQMGGDLIAIMAVIGALVAALVVAWTIYSFVARYARELAIGKAVGATNRSIIGAVIFQSALLAILGYLLACGLALALEPLLAAKVPEVAIRFASVSMLRAGVLALAVAVAAAIVPALRVIRVDPATVFSA